MRDLKPGDRIWVKGWPYAVTFVSRVKGIGSRDLDRVIRVTHPDGKSGSVLDADIDRVEPGGLGGSESMNKYDVIEPRLKHCAVKKTDEAFGLCVQRTMPFSNQGTAPVREKYIGKGSGSLIETDINGDVIAGGSGLRKTNKKCRSSEKLRPLRSCHVELDVPTSEEQRELGLPNAPVIRFCDTKSKPGAIVPVRSPEQALVAVNTFCACTGEQAPGEKRKKCARELSAKNG